MIASASSTNLPARLVPCAAACAAALAGVAIRLNAADWPQFLGPSRDGASAERVAASWPAAGPRVLWEAEVGEGYSAPVVAAGKLVIVHRVAARQIVECRDAATGKEIWKRASATSYRDDYGSGDGPRATPAVAGGAGGTGGTVYTFSAEGILERLDLDDGKARWTVETQKRFDIPRGFFGAACSPLVDGEKVIVNIGGAERHGIVAFAADDGRTLWGATNHEAGYASPTAVAIAGARHGLSLTREGLVDFDPDTGKTRFELPFRARIDASVNAATPIVIGERVFISASYGVGAALVRLGAVDAAAGGAGADAARARVVWSARDALDCHYATPVHRDGYIYGFHGRQEPPGPVLRCIEAATGKVRWSAERQGAGTILLAGGTLLVQLESGELVAAPASPEGFAPSARARPLAATVRAHAALADGRYYARDDNRIVCLDLGVAPPGPKD